MANLSVRATAARKAESDAAKAGNQPKGLNATALFIPKMSVKEAAKNALPTGAWTDKHFVVYESWFVEANPSNNNIRTNTARADAIANTLNVLRIMHKLPKKSTADLKYFFAKGKWPTPIVKEKVPVKKAVPVIPTVSATPTVTVSAKTKAKDALPSGKWSEPNFRVYETWFVEVNPSKNDLRKHATPSSSSNSIIGRLNSVRTAHGLSLFKNFAEAKKYLEQAVVIPVTFPVPLAGGNVPAMPSPVIESVNEPVYLTPPAIHTSNTYNNTTVSPLPGGNVTYSDPPPIVLLEESSPTFWQKVWNFLKKEWP